MRRIAITRRRNAVRGPRGLTERWLYDATDVGEERRMLSGYDRLPSIREHVARMVFGSGEPIELFEDWAGGAMYEIGPRGGLRKRVA